MDTNVSPAAQDALFADDSPSFDEYVAIIQRNFAVVRSSWNHVEREDARKVAAIACEQLADYIRRF